MISKKGRRFLAGALAGIVSFTTIGMTPMTMQATEMEENFEVSVNTEMVTDASTDALYRFVPSTSGNYEFYSMESGDTYGCIYDANKNVLYSDNDAGDELNFSITAELEANTEYYLNVSYFEIGAEGEIKWKVEESVESISEEQEAIVAEQTQPLETVIEETSVTNNGTTADGVYDYTEENGVITITQYNGTDEILAIPETIDGKPVGIIGRKAFEENQTVKEISLPKTVTEIQYAAFAGCTNLVNFDFGTDSNLQKLGREAFLSCKALVAIHLPDSLLEVEYGEFYGCTSLAEVTLGSGLKVISGSMFAYTESLKNITFPANITQIGSWAFVESGLLVLIIPDTITEIGQSAFYCCESLSEVTLGAGLKGISDRTFSETTSLKEISFPSNITYIGEQAFSYSGLETVTIPDTVTSVEEYAFFECKNLKEAIIGSGLTYLAEGVFANCALEEVTIGENVKTLGLFSFQANDFTEIVVPETVTELEYGVFLRCTDLESITIPEKLEKIGGHCFHKTKWFENQKDGDVYAGNVYYYYKGQMPQNTTVTIKDGTLGIAGFAFEEQENLINVEIPYGVTNIGELAFFECTSLKEIVIPSSVTEIWDYAIGYYRDGNAQDKINIQTSYHQTVWSVTKVSDMVIIGDTDSVAEAYAEKHGFAFEKNVYTVNFYNGEELVSTQQIVSGESAEAPVLTKEGYTLEWDINFNNVKQNLNVKAVWKNTTVVTNPFTDVSDSVYYYQPVLWALENGITAGINATQFAPEQSCTRGQVVTFLWRAMGSPKPSTTTNPFVDVNSNEYYYKAVLWALENGITAGTDATHFAPNDTVTRGQFVTFLHRAENKPSYSVSNPFSDVPNTYYYDAVLWAYENGVTAGTDSTHFSPEDFCTRGQVVTFLYRALNDK